MHFRMTCGIRDLTPKHFSTNIINWGPVVVYSLFLFLFFFEVKLQAVGCAALRGTRQQTLTDAHTDVTHIPVKTEQQHPPPRKFLPAAPQSTHPPLPPGQPPL